MRICSSVRARGLLRFNTAIVVSKELICKELGFSLEIHVAIFHHCRKTCGVFDIHSSFSNRVLITPKERVKTTEMCTCSLRTEHSKKMQKSAMGTSTSIEADKSNQCGIEMSD